MIEGHRPSQEFYSYYIVFLLTGILVFIQFGARYPILLILWGAALLLGTAFFIIVRKSLAPQLDPRILEDKYCNHFLWIYNEERNALLTNLFIAVKCFLTVFFRYAHNPGLLHRFHYFP